MDKKLYFIIDNGETSITCELSGAIAMLEAEAGDVKEAGVELYSWTITPVFMTEKEYEELPEAE